MEKVTVIVPFHNTEEYIEDCILSIINQSYNNLEIFLINDNSTDRSRKIAEKFADGDSRIKILDFNTKKGVGSARNYGVDLSTGEFIYFVDSDDIIHEDAIMLLVKNIEDAPLISGSISNILTFEDMADFELMNKQTVYRKALKTFRARSILKVLFRKDFILKNNLRFLEEPLLFSDRSYMYEVFNQFNEIKYCRDSRYFRRKRHDLVTNPALINTPREGKIKDFCKMYIELGTRYEDNNKVKKILDRDFLNFYRRIVVVYMSNPTNFEEIFELLHQSAKKLSKESILRMNLLIRKEIELLRKRNSHKFIKICKAHIFLRDTKRAFKDKGGVNRWLSKYVYEKKAIDDNLIVFESFMGKSYSCNPKAIYEYMLKRKDSYHYVWVYENQPLDIPGKVTQVKRFSRKYYKHMAIAKYWVFNTRIPKHINKRDEQIYLQTWHGTPLKKLGMDIKNVQMPGTDTGRYKKNFTDEAARWDYLIAPNKYSSDIFKRAFRFQGEMIESGYPRNDILQRNNERELIKIKERAGIPLDKKVILYAPTWRDNQFFGIGKYRFDLALNLDMMKKFLGDEYVVALRLHYVVASQLDLTGYEGFAFDLSKYDDISELYLISDILITDYSSVFFDYANLKRPMLFYTYDLEDYRDNVRGLYFNFEDEVPGPLLKSTSEIIQSINNIKQLQRKYKEKYEEFYQRFNNWEDGKATEKVVDKVFN